MGKIQKMPRFTLQKEISFENQNRGAKIFLDANINLDLLFGARIIKQNAFHVAKPSFTGLSTSVLLSLIHSGKNKS